MPSSTEARNDEQTPLLHGVESKSGHYNLVGLSPASFWLLCFSIWIACFLVALDGTIVTTLLGPISSSFLATNSASWLGTSYLLAVCCCTPIYGRLCNIIGRRQSVLIATVIFAAGNTLCAVAPSMSFLIAARCIAGIGGGGLQTTTSTIASDIVPLSHRGIFQGYANIIFGLGGALGAPLGGFINDTIGWRWTFWLQLPFFVIAFVAVFFKVRYTVHSSTTPTTQTPLQALKRVDFLGSLLLAVWLGAALIAMSLKTDSTDDEYEWTSPTILGLFAVAFVGFLVFLVVELEIAKEPIVPVELLKRRTPIAVFINNFSMSWATFAMLFSIPLFFTTVRQMSAGDAGKHLILNPFVGMVTAIGVGFYVKRYGRYYWLTFISGLFGVLSAILLAGWDVNTPDWMLYTNFMFAYLSGAGVTTLTVVALIASVGRDGIAMATSLSYVARTIGQVLGVAMGGALVQTVLSRELSRRITGSDAEKYITIIRESSASIRTLPDEYKVPAIQSYRQSLHLVFIACIVFNAISVLAGLGIDDIDTNKPAPAKPVDEEREDA